MYRLRQCGELSAYISKLIFAEDQAGPSCHVLSLVGLLVGFGLANVAVGNREHPLRATPNHSTAHLLFLSVLNLSSGVGSIFALFFLRPLRLQFVRGLLSIEASYVFLDSIRVLFGVVLRSGQGTDLLVHHVATLTAVYTVRTVNVRPEALLRILAAVNLSGFTVAFVKLYERWRKCSQVGLLASAAIFVGRLAWPIAELLPDILHYYKDLSRPDASISLARECFVHAFWSLLTLNCFYCYCFLWRVKRGFARRVVRTRV